MELAKKRGFEGINPRWFLEAAAKEGACCSVGDVISFFLTVKNHLVKLFEIIRI